MSRPIIESELLAKGEREREKEKEGKLKVANKSLAMLGNRKFI